MGMEPKDYLQAIIEDEGFKQIESLYTHLDLKEQILSFRLKEIRPRDREEERIEREVEITEILKISDDLCIIGAPGSGKTTSLKWLTLKYAQKRLSGEDVPIPVYCDLTRFTSAYKDFEEFSSLILKEEMRGGLIFLIDGLDLLTEERIDLIAKFISESQLKRGSLLHQVAFRFNDFRSTSGHLSRCQRAFG